jgi:hypothetical protein
LSEYWPVALWQRRRRKSDLRVEQSWWELRFPAEVTISLGRFLMQVFPLLIVVLIAASLAYVRMTV